MNFLVPRGFGRLYIDHILPLTVNVFYYMVICTPCACAFEYSLLDKVQYDCLLVYLSDFVVDQRYHPSCYLSSNVGNCWISCRVSSCLFSSNSFTVVVYKYCVNIVLVIANNVLNINCAFLFSYLLHSIIWQIYSFI